jgi:nucleotide-binding universal stress UspA family protein
MKKLFTNMLVPVVSVQDVGLIADEAIRLARQLQCHVHFLCFTPGGPSSTAPNRSSSEDTSLRRFDNPGLRKSDDPGLRKFEQMKAGIQERYQLQVGPAFPMVISRQAGALINGVLEYYSRNGIDLILLGRLHRTGAVHANRLLRKIDCPVITIYKKPAVSRLKNIVLPVGDHLPLRKLLFATYLARITHSTIHLVTTAGKSGDPDERSAAALQKSYRLLRENTDLPVQCMAMPGGNLAEIAWNYARGIGADLIMVNTGKEPLLSGFLNGLRAKYLNGAWSRSLLNISRIPVMSIG